MVRKNKSRASYGIQHKGLIHLLGHFSFKFPQQQGSIQQATKMTAYLLKA